MENERRGEAEAEEDAWKKNERSEANLTSSVTTDFSQSRLDATRGVYGVAVPATFYLAPSRPRGIINKRRETHCQLKSLPFSFLLSVSAPRERERERDGD